VKPSHDEDRYFRNEVIGIVETNSNYRIGRVNPGICRMLEYSADELLSFTWMDVTHPEDNRKAKDHFARLFEGSVVGAGLEIRCITKSGKILNIAFNVQPGPPGINGKPDHYLSFIVDISRQKAAEAEALTVKQRLDILSGKIGDALNGALEVGDPYTVGHQQHVVSFADGICRLLGLPDIERRTVVAAAGVHDIGKIGVPSQYLSKPTKLTDLEWAVIRSHAKIGYDILSPMHLEFPVADIVYQHHERLDGSGYPQGLSHGDILLSAQIIAAADIADSTINPRPYRRGLGRERTIEILQSERGVKLEADITDACIDVINALPT
jgi:PAS domain S-box-containing protein